MGIDLCLPSLPAIGLHFGVTVARSQLTLTAFLLGFGLMQAIYGPLSERYGRRKIMLIGLSVAVVGNACTAWAPGMAVFLASRFVAGSGSSVIWVLQRSIMRDVFVDRSEMTRFASQIAATWAITLAVAPILGGYIQTYLGWRFQFLLLAALSGLATYLVWKALPETKAAGTGADSTIAMVGRGYLELGRNFQFIRYVLLCSLAFGVIMAYNVIGPFIFMGHFGLSPVRFGWLGILVSFTYFLTTMFNSRFGARFETDRLLLGGAALMIGGGVLLLVLEAATVQSPLLPMPAIMACIVGMGLACPNATVAAMSTIQTNFGLASSLFGCIQMLGSTGITWLSGAWFHPSLATLGFVIMGIGSALVGLILMPSMK
jgi:Bcr/CflA subfamily drug resistance transporter